MSEVPHEIEICFWCARKIDKSYVVDGKVRDGLTWLFPDERWICPTCLKTKIYSIPATN